MKVIQYLTGPLSYHIKAVSHQGRLNVPNCVLVLGVFVNMMNLERCLPE